MKTKKAVCENEKIKMQYCSQMADFLDSVCWHWRCMGRGVYAACPHGQAIANKKVFSSSWDKGAFSWQQVKAI